MTASTSETGSELAMVAGATLVVSAGTFTLSNGSGAGALAGSIDVDAGAVLALAGFVDNSGTLTIAGQLGGGAFALSNSGTVNADGTAGVTIDLTSGSTLANSASGLIEATGAGGLTITSGTVSNAGTMLANGGALAFAPGVVNSNNSGGVLSWGTFKWSGGVGVGGGTWEAAGSGSTLAITGGAVTTDRASIILSGAGSVFEAGNGSIFTGLQASLADIAPIGMLELDAGASVTASHAISVFGTIVLANGTLTSGGLALGSTGHVRGSGTIAETRNAILNGGTIEANGGTLAIATAVDAKSSGVFVLDAASVLEIAADQGAADTMKFAGAGGELVIDDAHKFGLNVGKASYTGPLIENFGASDEILLKNLAPAGLTPVYNATTGLLQISNGTTSLASLMFQNSSLGAGTFHIMNSDGFVLLTHS